MTSDPGARVRPALACAAVVLASALTAVMAAPPARADSPEPIESGRTRGVGLYHSSIQISTNYGGGGSGDGWTAPQPCWYEPAMSEQAAVRIILAIFSGLPFPFWIPDPKGQKDLQEIAEQVKKSGKIPSGRFWYPASLDTPDGIACFGGLKPMLFVPDGQTPPGGITAEQLAQVARSVLTVPEPRIGVNPDQRSYVELPTWVWAQGIGDTTRSVTASIPGYLSATVVAKAGDLQIDSGAAAGQASVYQRCGPAGTPRPGRVPPGPPDCGVIYHRSSASQPGGAYRLTVTMTWRVGWRVGTGAFDPGAGNMAPVVVSGERTVPVWEVQTNVDESH